jgi:phospholipid/cholesterol/gamma-HCH transport system substrate-binding protein
MSRKSNWSHLLLIHEIRVLLAGAVLVSSVLVMLAFVAGYLHTHNVARQDFQATVLFDDGTGLVRGTKVMVRGVEVGSVDDIDLNDQGRVVMTLRIPQSYRHMIRTNWVCYPMRDRNMVSDRVLNIDDTTIDPEMRRRNLKNFPSLPSSGEITFQTAQGRDLESILQTVAGLASQVQVTLNRVNDILTKVNDTTNTLGLVLNRKDAYTMAMGTLRETRDVIAESRTGVGSLVRTGAVLERQTPPLMDSMRTLLSTATRSARVAEHLMSQGDTLFQKSGGVVDKVDDLLERSDRLIDGASNSWPFRSMLRNSGSHVDQVPAGPLP